MGDDGVVFVPLHHADIEETRILGVHDGLQRAFAAVAVILWGLDDRDARIAKPGYEVLKPGAMHLVVGIEHADHGGVGRHVLQCPIERPGLEAADLGQINEFETGSQRGAVFCRDRFPETFLGSVVDDGEHLEIRIVEDRQAVERRLQHFGPFAVGRNVDGHEGRRDRGDRAGGGRARSSARVRVPGGPRRSHGPLKG